MNTQKEATGKIPDGFESAFYLSISYIMPPIKLNVLSLVQTSQKTL
ncbi:hypothetical protein [Enterococcus gilvus]|nr:hypothetical protein [Enterococcus gilvus]OJG44866.1 hypothetical protein RV02_GL000472 [Enterococcus gilvus]